MLELLAGSAATRTLRRVLIASVWLASLLLALRGDAGIVALVAIPVILGVCIPLAIAMVAGLQAGDGGLYHVERCPTCGRAVYVTVRVRGVDPIAAAQSLVEHHTALHGRPGRRSA